MISYKRVSEYGGGLKLVLKREDFPPEADA
jgi:hypothetical protein